MSEGERERNGKNFCDRKRKKEGKDEDDDSLQIDVRKK